MCMVVSTYLYIIQTNLLQKQPTNISNEMNIGFVQSCPAENGKITFHLSRPCGCNPQYVLGRAVADTSQSRWEPWFLPMPSGRWGYNRSNLLWFENSPFSNKRTTAAVLKKVLQVKKTSGRHYLQQGPN